MTEPAHRPLWTALGLLLAAAVALWVAALLPTPSPVPALLSLAALSLAVGAAVPATGGGARRLLGVLTVLAGAVPFGVVLSSRPPAAAAALCVLAGLAMVAAGTLVAVRGHHMPGMGARYRTGRRPRGERAAWDELDAGRDPTG
jgi:hypothetical protein